MVSLQSATTTIPSQTPPPPYHYPSSATTTIINPPPQSSFCYQNTQTRVLNKPNMDLKKVVVLTFMCAILAATAGQSSAASPVFALVAPPKSPVKAPVTASPQMLFLILKYHLPWLSHRWAHLHRWGNSYILTCTSFFMVVHYFKILFSNWGGNVM